jgi:3-hydroxyisobutyrate dehydrogenase
MWIKNMKSVAFIGLGRMGHGMAGRYLDAGFNVAVWNRSKAKADDLIARGARWAASPADAASGADAVVTTTSRGASGWARTALRL